MVDCIISIAFGGGGSVCKQAAVHYSALLQNTFYSLREYNDS